LSDDKPVVRDPKGKDGPCTIKARRLGADGWILGQHSEIGLDTVLPTKGVVDLRAIKLERIGNRGIATPQHCPCTVDDPVEGKERGSTWPVNTARGPAERPHLDEFVMMVLRCLILWRSVLRRRHWWHRQDC